MATFQQAQQNALRVTPQRISDDLFSFIRTLEQYLVELNREALNKRSEDVEGKPIGFYSPATEYISLNNALLGKGNKIKRAGDPFTLEETGFLLKSIFTRVEQESIFFENNDPKLLEVFRNTLSDNLFGLQDVDLQSALDEKIRPFLIHFFKTELG